MSFQLRLINAGKEQKQVERAILREKLALGESGDISKDDLRAALETIRKEHPPPRTVEAREQYFMTQVSLGEQLALQGQFTIPQARTQRVGA
jgi:import receptor subunit TOM20